MIQVGDIVRFKNRYLKAHSLFGKSGRGYRKSSRGKQVLMRVTYVSPCIIRFRRGRLTWSQIVQVDCSREKVLASRNPHGRVFGGESSFETMAQWLTVVHKGTKRHRERMQEC